MFKIIFSAFTLVCLVNCAPNGQLTEIQEKCHKALTENSGRAILIADPDDVHKFHECGNGDDAGTFTCEAHLVFNEKVQACVYDVNHLDTLCKSANGYFEYPSDKHKFVVCNEGHAYVLTCPSGLVWNESNTICVYDN